MGLRSVPCLSLTKDCFDAATLQIKLDDNLHWLVVLVLPADAFTLTAASQQSAWESFLHKRDSFGAQAMSAQNIDVDWHGKRGCGKGTPYIV